MDGTTIRGLGMQMLEQYTLKHLGEEGLERLLQQAASLDAEPWLACLDYPPDEQDRLLAALASTCGETPAMLIEKIARWSTPRLLQRYAPLIGNYPDARALFSALSDDHYHTLNLLSPFTDRARVQFSLEELPAAESDAAAADNTSLAHAQVCLLEPVTVRIRIEGDDAATAAIQGLLQGVSDHFGCQAFVEHQTEAFAGAGMSHRLDACIRREKHA